MSRRTIIVYCSAVIVVGGLVWVAAGMGPLGVLSVPFGSTIIHVDASPCILDLAVDADRVDRTAFVHALNSYAASNGFRADDDDPTPPGTRRLASFTGAGTLSMLISAQTGRVSVQLFKDVNDHAAYAKEASAAIATLEPVGLKPTACK